MRGPGRGARGAWSWAAHRLVKGQRQAAFCRARQGFYVLPEGGPSVGACVSASARCQCSPATTASSATSAASRNAWG